eukprot:TRINITY_DN23519_c1_g2_i1.p1 TRINITY_DN23519_c1_g2~~TRINITY_DN23519_c1_g2_i1.p1  ORF type:complete len:400 (+),score=42.45 TRINITY_DN23519_c1_g2_i1:79-1200(+)
MAADACWQRLHHRRGKAFRLWSFRCADFVPWLVAVRWLPAESRSIRVHHDISNTTIGSTPPLPLRLLAYWDDAGCGMGPHGARQNAAWCVPTPASYPRDWDGLPGATDCRHRVPVDRSICSSRLAELEVVRGDGTDWNVNVLGCRYAFLAMYGCVRVDGGRLLSVGFASYEDVDPSDVSNGTGPYQAIMIPKVHPVKVNVSELPSAVNITTMEDAVRVAENVGMEPGQEVLKRPCTPVMPFYPGDSPCGDPANSVVVEMPDEFVGNGRSSSAETTAAEFASAEAALDAAREISVPARVGQPGGLPSYADLLPSILPSDSYLMESSSVGNPSSHGEQRTASAVDGVSDDFAQGVALFDAEAAAHLRGMREARRN